MANLTASKEPCRLLTWDSDHWGFPIGSLLGHHLDDSLLEKALRWCRENALRCLFFAADGTCSRTLELAWQKGFRFVDVRLDLGLELADRPSGASSDVDIRLARAGDLPALMQLARNSHQDTRFFKDPGFEKAGAAELYAKWIQRDFRENKLFVASLPAAADSPVGYLTVGVSSPGGARIGLVAVDSRLRRGGVAKALVQHALWDLAGQEVRSVRVATQATNIAAVRLYEESGFRLAETHVWFHRWFGDKEN